MATRSGATSGKAIEALEHARLLDPTRIQYYYDLARVYKYEGLRRRAIRPCSKPP
ncbi:MAG: hypothetical protein WKG07_48685 [Hymenobacter sp.]